MSVQSEITRLENAKASIKAAIEGKGVTVPDATLLDGMAALIESIEAGGGNDLSGILDSDDCEFGTYTIASSSRRITIPTVAKISTHSLKFVMLWAEQDAIVLGMFGFRGKSNSGGYGLQMLMTISHANVKFAVCKPSMENLNGQFGRGKDEYGGNIELTVGGTRFDPYSNWSFEAGITYNYVIFAKSK